MSRSTMINYKITIPDANNFIRKIIKVKDIQFNKELLYETNEWLWIFEDNNEFCPFELWSFMDRVKVHDGLIFNHKIYKVIEVTKMNKIRYI